MTTHTLLHSVVHNYSNLHLTQSHLAVLDKGLSFTIHQPFQLKDKLTLLTQYDSFGHSLRKSVMSNRLNQSTPSSVPTTTSQTFIYRSMRFLRNIPQKNTSPSLHRKQWNSRKLLGAHKSGFRQLSRKTRRKKHQKSQRLKE